MGVPCSTNGTKRNTYRVLDGKPEGKIPLGRPRRRRVGSIKTDSELTGFWTFSIVQYSSS
jgi:hypothetical protein